MVKLTITTGLLLLALGLISYFATGTQSITALIPAFFGILILFLGLLSRQESARKIAMHAAVGLAFLGLLGSISGPFKLIALLSGGDVARPSAVVAQAIMAVICLVFVIAGIRSFILARRRG